LLAKKWLCGRRPKIATGRSCSFVGFSTHATTDIILEAVQSDEFDYLNVHWYFVNDLNWPAIEAAKQLDLGVFIISPNDKGGNLRTTEKSWSSCARADTDAI